jgi:predicted transcriptional regulator
MAKRDVKNVADDVKYLDQIGLIEKKKTKRRIAPVVTYEKLMLEIAV